MQINTASCRVRLLALDRCCCKQNATCSDVLFTIVVRDAKAKRRRANFYDVRFMVWAVYLSSVVRDVVAPYSITALNFSAIFLHLLIVYGPAQSVLKFWGKIPRGSRWSRYRTGMKNWRFSTNISLYIWNGKRYCHSYNGRRIRKWSFRGGMHGTPFLMLKNGQNAWELRSHC